MLKSYLPVSNCKGKEITGMGFINLTKSLNRERRAFSSQTLVKVENDNVKWLGKFVQKWTLIPLKVDPGE